MKMLPDPAVLQGLYAVSPSPSLIAAALKGGVRLVQYRDKSKTNIQTAIELHRLCRDSDATLIINDSVTLAAEIGAEGAHIGRDDPYYTEIAEARSILGPDKLLGVSCYDDLNLAQRAVDDGADYVAFGSVFASPTKPDACRVSLATLREARRRFKCPIVAIGGITLKNAPDVLATGVDILAVSSGLFNVPDISECAENFLRMMNHDSQ